MKVARFFAVIFAVLGVLLLLGSMGWILASRDAPVRVLEVPQGAVQCSEAFASALENGDLAAVAERMYGQPDLGIDGVISDPETALVWEAFLEQMRFSFTGKCYPVDNGFARDASIEVLDIARVTEKLPELTKTLINQKIASAERLEEIYDEAGRFHPELADQILREALQQALSQDPEVICRDVAVKLVNRDGAWWVVPDQMLLQTISGLA